MSSSARHPVRHALLVLLMCGAPLTGASCDASGEEGAMMRPLFDEMIDVTPARDARARWLREQLLLENRDMLERETALTRGKFRKMAVSPYAYFRGTANIFWRDVLEPGPHHQATRFGAPALSAMLLLGDPHPENLGTFRDAKGTYYIDFNDFDASTFGPTHLDLWRLSVGCALFALESGVGEERLDGLIDALVGAYFDTVHGEGAASDFAMSAPEDAHERHGEILGDLVRRAARDGAIAEELSEYAPLDERGERQMFLGDLEPQDVRHALFEDTLTALSEEEERQLRASFATYAASLSSPTALTKESLQIKGMSRKLGSGVSSYPVRRYYVLLEGGGDGVEDDVLLEVKETLDPPAALSRLPLLANERDMHNAERVVRAQRRLQHDAAQDPWLGWLGERGETRSMRVRWRSKYQRGLSLDRVAEKVAEGEWGGDDLEVLYTRAGALLARAHQRAPSLNEGDFTRALRAVSANQREAFIAEARDFTRRYILQIMSDHERLRAIVALHGDHLGYRSQQR